MEVRQRVLQRNRDYICLGLAVLAALTLLGLPAARQEAVAQGLRSSAFAAGQRVFSRAIRFARAQERTQHLLTQNVELSVENMLLREAGEENLRLRQALQFRERQAVDDVIPAEVIARDPEQTFDVLVINAGQDMGVRENWPVVTAAGLVGHIDAVDEHSSVVRLIFGTRVSAIVEGSRAHGMVWPLSGNRFQLRYVEASSQIQVGDRVVSSGLGGLYPKGLTIGYVTDVHSGEENPLFKQIQLESEVDFWGLEEVFVIHPSPG